MLKKLIFINIYRFLGPVISTGRQLVILFLLVFMHVVTFEGSAG